MWLLVSLLCLGLVAASDWQTVQLNRKWTTLRENSTHWRSLATQRRQDNIDMQDVEPEEGIPLMHIIRILGCAVLLSQVCFILHLSLRVFVNGYIVESANEGGNFQLIDRARQIMKEAKKEPARRPDDVSVNVRKIVTPTPTPDFSIPVEQEDLVTAEAASDRFIGEAAKAKAKAKRRERDQSSRLPRPKKGENQALIDDQILDFEDGEKGEEQDKKKDPSGRSRSEAPVKGEDATAEGPQDTHEGIPARKKKSCLTQDKRQKEEKTGQ